MPGRLSQTVMASQRVAASRSRSLLVIASEAKQSIAPQGSEHGLLRFARNDGGYSFVFSRHIAPEVCRLFSRPLETQRSQGMPDARCTRDLMRNVHKKCAHEHTGQRRTSDIPCAMVLRLITRSPR